MPRNATPTRAPFVVAAAAQLLLACASASAQEAATCRVYLYCDKPWLFGAGHAFIGLDPGTGTEWRGGLYPTRSGTSAYNCPGVINDDTAHGYDYRMCWMVTPTAYNKIVTAVIAKQTGGVQYQLCPRQTAGPGTNCAGWADQKLRTGGITGPSPWNRAGYPDPYALGQVMASIGCGNTYNGGTLYCSDGKTTPEGDPVQKIDPVDGGYFGILDMGHDNPSGLADLFLQPLYVEDGGALSGRPGSAFTVKFTNVEAGALQSVEWGDGSMFTDGSSTQSHAYAAAGSYRGSALVIDSAGVRFYELAFTVADGAPQNASVTIELPRLEPAPVFELEGPPADAPQYAKGLVPRAADFNLDGAVDVADVSMLLADWGAELSACDLNFDYVVSSDDLALLLGEWGLPPVVVE